MNHSEPSNRLIYEKSPYLLQHAHNPVDWYPWGEEAFARARKKDKPVFLSIGYSTCHWCHVMARECFENPVIADLLNRWFVSIKVDREERPDVDRTYMAATQAMTGAGGWPMSVFLFADGTPFYAATYIPPAPIHGRPGFPQLLEAIHSQWQKDRKPLRRQGQELLVRLEGKESTTRHGSIGADLADHAFFLLGRSFDPDHGGFGSAPKFPRPVALDFLTGYAWSTGNRHGLNMVSATLKAMADGGIHDHLGGGFHRYSVDTRWRLPHFEKMAYDQAQLIVSYLDTYLFTGDERFAAIAEQTASYVVTRLQDQEGGFYSAEDADSKDPDNPGHQGEGAYYMWTDREIREILGAEPARLFFYCYGIRADGNVIADPHGEFQGRNILYRAHSDDEAADRFGMRRPQVAGQLAECRGKLLAARNRRHPPHLDDKIITGWNGLMIGSLARAAAVLQRDDFLDAASRAAGFVRDRLCDRQNKTLWRRFRGGEQGVAGQLDDYGYLVRGLIQLYQVRQEPELLAWAIELAGSALAMFWDSSDRVMHESGVDPNMPLRLREEYEGAEPSANAVMAENLLFLAHITGNHFWQERAAAMVAYFTSRISAMPVAMPSIVRVSSLLARGIDLVVVAGKRDDPETSAMLRAVHASYHPARFLVLADGDANQRYLRELNDGLPLGDHVPARVTAHVCQAGRCLPPVDRVEALLELLG